jgi:hypothetical protein
VAEIEAEFYARGSSASPVTASLNIGAGNALGYADFVSEVFGIRNAVGTVILESSNGTEISATAREYAILRDQEGYVVGTAGTGLPGLTESQMLRPGFTRHILGLRQEMRGIVKERSHLAIFNPGANPATVTVSLFNENGNGEGSRSWTVESKELIHINGIMKKINPEVDADAKRLEVTSEGPVQLHAFRVNTWGDSVTLNGFDRTSKR